MKQNLFPFACMITWNGSNFAKHTFLLLALRKWPCNECSIPIFESKKILGGAKCCFTVKH